MLLMLAVLGPIPGGAWADDEKKNTEIHITADVLVSDRNARYAEFQGHVVAIQEGSTLTSDRLKITYISRDEEPDPSGEPKKTDDDTAANPASGIETIVATGTVKMVMEDKTAWAEKATFNRMDDTITLTGGKPKVISGKSTITGETIIMNRTTGQVTVHGGANQRVEAFFYEDDMDKSGKTGPDRKKPRAPDAGDAK